MMAKKEQVPAIRFQGFADPWEQRKLGDIADIVGGGTPSTGNQSYWDGEIDWYAPARNCRPNLCKFESEKDNCLGL